VTNHDELEVHSSVHDRQDRTLAITISAGALVIVVVASVLVVLSGS
jgi:hypothetical protein